MIKWVLSVVLLVICVLLALSVIHSTSLRRASLTDGMNRLRVAYDGYTVHGYVTITNRPTSSYQVWLSTNVVTIGSTKYHCFAEVGGGWGYEGGTLAITTNRGFIWLDGCVEFTV